MKKILPALIFCLLMPGMLRFSHADPAARKEQDPETTSASLRLQWFDEHVRLKQESIFNNLKWRSIGPIESSGRISDIAVPKGIPYTIYTSAGTGGVWKSTNNGTTWKPLLDDIPTCSVGDIAVSESNPDIVWVGTGENNPRWWTFSGTGVYKSTDGGGNWEHMGLSDTHTTGRIVIDPKNPDRVFVAAMGHIHTSNEERGVFRTTDGGKTWKKVLYIDEKTGVTDLAMDPSDSNILYAAAWQRIRKPWKITEYGPGSGLYKSSDGGDTWKSLENGFLTGDFIGRIGLDISRSNPNVVYALVDNNNDMTDPRALARGKNRTTLRLIVGAEVYRSNDKGESWRKVNTDDITDLYHLPFNYGFYFGQIRVSPDDEDEIYLLGAPMFHSIDGGKTYGRISHPAMHGDHQAMWIDPENPNHIIGGNDGGLNVTYDRGATWEDIEMPLGQFYAVALDMDEPFNVYGSLQDNMSWYGPVTCIPGISGSWKNFPGGERSAIAFDTSDYQTIYTTAGLTRVDRKDWSTTSIIPRNFEVKLRKNWYPHLIVSPHNPQILYYGTQMLLRSLDRGDTWQAISPDLSNNNPERYGTVFVQHSTIISISESPFKFGLIYAGTDDGNVHVTKNGGVSWERIQKALPAERWVSSLVASKYSESTVYATLSGLRNDDLSAYVYKSTDYGKTWMDIANNIPGGPVNLIKEDPKKANVLYVGTDMGIYVSLDKGESWHSLCSSLPTVIVNDIAVHPRDNMLVIGTHGRSAYALDVNPVQEFDQKVSRKEIHLFSPSTVYRVRERSAGQEAPLYYYSKAAGPVRVDIADESGKTIKKFPLQGEKGINAVFWDLKPDGSSRAVPPGKYTVILTAGENTHRQSLLIKSPGGN